MVVCPNRDRTIFCVHGLTASCRCWDVTAGALSPYYRIVAMDLRGRGLSEAPFLQPWSPALEAHFRYEVEEVDGGARSRVRPEHIEEEVLNLEKVVVSRFYADILCPVLILRAPKGMLNNDDILLPQDALERMLREIPDARCVHVDGANHYSIIFQPSDVRDLAIREFLTD